jgi:hypothetical protein
VAELTGVIPASARMHAVLVPAEGCEDKAQRDYKEDRDLATFARLLDEGNPDCQVDFVSKEENAHSMLSTPLSGKVRSSSPFPSFPRAANYSRKKAEIMRYDKGAITCKLHVD